VEAHKVVTEDIEMDLVDIEMNIEGSDTGQRIRLVNENEYDSGVNRLLIRSI
jgi:hypothetical protein